MILSNRINSIFLCHIAILPLIASLNSFKISRDPNDVHFYLYPFKETPEIYEEIIYNDTNSLKKSSYRPDKKLVLLVHGFVSDGVNLENMPQLIKNAYLQTDLDYNYIVVDWGNLSAADRNSPSRIITAGQYLVIFTKNVPTIAKRIADFLTFLESNYMIISFREVHFIGHSLGAQIGGQVGRLLQRSSGFEKQLGRITGLDPAGPLFQPPINFQNSLQKTDGIFVQVIHTNGGVLGTTSVNGHVDIYVDGGRKIEACCSKNDSVTAFARNAWYSPSDPSTQICKVGFCFACSHSISFRLYAASLRNNFYACKCAHFDSKPLLPPVCLSDCTDRILVGHNCPPTAKGRYGLQLNINQDEGPTLF